MHVGDGDPLAAGTINKTLATLSRILERARKRKLIEHNVADDKELRVRDRKAGKAHLDAAGRSKRC